MPNVKKESLPMPTPRLTLGAVIREALDEKGMSYRNAVLTRYKYEQEAMSKGQVVSEALFSRVEHGYIEEVIKKPAAPVPPTTLPYMPSGVSKAQGLLRQKHQDRQDGASQEPGNKNGPRG